MAVETLIYDERTRLVFIPDREATAADGASNSGHYELEPQGVAGQYTYVPKAAPDRLARDILQLATKVTFSIVTPVHNTPAGVLRATIASVQDQWYPYWELILVDDASTSVETACALDKTTDPRVVVVKLEANAGISNATNVAIQHARGDYLVFLDHDDLLTVDCLYELAMCIAETRADFIYSDEDKIDASGQYVEPLFKPDWSPDTMMSTMITCHVACVRRATAVTLGGLRAAYDGCQDWDLVLRLSEHTSNIRHIPKVLYHWRVTSASVSLTLDAKPYVVDASKRAREEALARRGALGELVPVARASGHYAIRYKLRDDPTISIIIPTRDNDAILRRCIGSIIDKSTYENYEIIVVDNGSRNVETLEYLSDLRTTGVAKVIVDDEPFNYSRVNNIGVSSAIGDIIIFLNDDTEVLTGDWIQHLSGYAQQPHVGAVGAELLYPDMLRIQHAGLVNLPDGPGHAFLNMDFRMPGYFSRNLHEHNWLAVTGACMVIEKRKFESAGGFDEDLPIAYNDVALCFSLAELGLYQVVCPGVRLIHHESTSRGSDDGDPLRQLRLKHERQVLYAKHPSFFTRDPFYNVNFETREGALFKVA